MAEFFEDKYEDKYVEVNGLRLHYTDWGGSSKKPLLMVHGLNVQCHTWDPIADQLREEYRVYCLDLRGHGDSDWAQCARDTSSGRRNDGYPLETFVSDLHEVAKKLDIIPFDYVGHSLGVRNGIGLAGQYPDIVKHVALSDAAPEVSRNAALALRDRIGKTSGGGNVRGYKTEEEVRDHYAEEHPEWEPIFVDLHAHYQVRRNWAGRLVLKTDPDLYWITGAASLREVPHLWDMASKMTAPTLIMWGERSHLVDEELVDRMLKVMPNAKAAKFNTGHYIPRENSAEFVRVLREFLAI